MKALKQRQITSTTTAIGIIIIIVLLEVELVVLLEVELGTGAAVGALVGMAIMLVSAEVEAMLGVGFAYSVTGKVMHDKTFVEPSSRNFASTVNSTPCMILKLLISGTSAETS